jgi:anion-transporting  ArsA/GET3 family ATPase
LTDLLDRRFLVVTGKGGTGKTSVSAALALIAARANKRVLLCEIDRSGDLGRAFEVEDLGFEPRSVHERLDVMVMDTEAALSEYLRLNLKVPSAIRLGPFAKAFDFVATAAPGVREVLTIGKLCWEVKRDNYDLVIADAPASGHVVSQLDSAGSVGGLVDSGPLASQTAWMRDMLTDPQRSGAVLVTTPEEVPVAETLELMDDLQSRTQTPLAAVIANRTMPPVFLRGDEEIFDRLSESQLGSSIGHIDQALAATRLGVSLRRSQSRNLEYLANAMPPELPLISIGQSFETQDLASVVSHIHKDLAAEVG